MTITTSTKPSGAISYMGTPAELADVLASLIGPAGPADARPRHNEIVRAVDLLAGQVGARVILWSKYGLTPGVRMVTLKYNGHAWRVTDDDFIPTPEHKGAVTLFTDGTRHAPTGNTPATYPSARNLLGH